MYLMGLILVGDENYTAFNKGWVTQICKGNLHLKRNSNKNRIVCKYKNQKAFFQIYDWIISTLVKGIKVWTLKINFWLLSKTLNFDSLNIYDSQKCWVRYIY